MNQPVKDPTEHGLQIRLDPHTKYLDVFDYVRQHFMIDPELGDLTPMDAVDRYISTARSLFQANQPISQDFMGPTLALRFQDGCVLPFVDVTAPPTTGGNNGSVPLATVHPPKGAVTKDRTVPTHSWGVTHGEQ